MIEFMGQYIDKSVLVAEIERRIKEHHSGYLVCLKDILSFIDTLKVKEFQEKNLYVVTRCEEHSDYVEKVFFSKKKAEEYCKQFEGDEDAYGRDITKIKVDCPPFEVKEMDLDNELDFVKDAYYYFTSDERSSMKQVAKHFFELGLKAQKENLWKPADGDDLPEIDREVIALLDNDKAVFAHRPPKYWNGKNIITNEVTRYEPKRYDKGGWNQPDVKWWLDLDLPKMEE